MKPSCPQLLLAADIAGGGRFNTPGPRLWGWFCWRTILSGLIIAVSGTLWARDPVPAEMENATPEVKRKQMEATEQKDLDSYVRKLREGQRRYDERQEFKRGIVADLERDVLQEQREMEAFSQASNRHAPDSTVTLLVNGTVPGLVLAVIGYAFLLWRHFFWRLVGWTHYPLGARRPPPLGRKQSTRQKSRHAPPDRRARER